MAKEKKEKTPGYEEFHDALQSGAVGNVYIFHGEETYLMQQAVAELQARLVPAGFEEFNYHRLAGKGLTMQEVVDLLADEYGWSDSVSNLSNKLQRESLRYTEAVQLADVLGFEIVWRKRGDR